MGKFDRGLRIIGFLRFGGELISSYGVTGDRVNFGYLGFYLQGRK